MLVQVRLKIKKGLFPTYAQVKNASKMPWMFFAYTEPKIIFFIIQARREGGETGNFSPGPPGLRRGPDAYAKKMNTFYPLVDTLVETFRKG